MGLEWRLEETELQDEVGDWVVEKLLVQRLVWVGILGDRAVQTFTETRSSKIHNELFWESESQDLQLVLLRARQLSAVHSE